MPTVTSWEKSDFPFASGCHLKTASWLGVESKVCIHYGHLKYLFRQCLPLSEVFNPFTVNNHSQVIFRCRFIILLLVFCLISFLTFISSKLLLISCEVNIL